MCALRSPVDVLSEVRVDDHSLQPFVPLRDSLEWELAQLHWSRAGLGSFVRNEVPFLINNSGRLSEHAAALLYQACLASRRTEGRFVAVEVGAGLGLFARYLLDAFKAICDQERRPFYERLLLVVTDRSPRTVEQWREVGLFSAHRDRVLLATCDARNPSSLTPLDPASAPPFDLADLMAVYANYVLDVLPAAIVRRAGDGIEELYVRTVISPDADLLAQHTTLTREHIGALARSERAEDRARLLPLTGLLDLEAEFREVAPAARAAAVEAFTLDPGADRLAVNFGAIEALRAWIPRLAGTGFVLVNDYGISVPVADGKSLAGTVVPQRFGPTMALGLSFPLIERALRADGTLVEAGPGDEHRAVHSRLLTRGPIADVQATFHSRFSHEVDRHLDVPLEDARGHAAAGRKTEALNSYRLALDRNPRDWRLIGEIAELVGLQLLDYAAGAELARGAIEINPWFSPWLFNVLGDCLFCLRRFDEAHEAYLGAARLDPDDARANLNLAYTLAQRGEVAEALQMIARGLAGDAAGMLRTRLLDKQAQLLSTLTARFTADRERTQARLERLR